MDIETGTVVAVNVVRGVCDVLLTSGGTLYDVPVMNIGGGIYSGGVSWLSDLRGSVVAIVEIENRPHILGTVPVPALAKVATGADIGATEVGSSESQTYGRKTEARDYSGGRGRYFLPGDKFLSADGGSEMLLGREGFVVLRASALAQLIMTAVRDQIRMVAREFELFTDFGTMRFAHGDKGRTGLSIEGGAIYDEEAMPGGGVHTVHMHLGDTPDVEEGRFGVRVNSVDGAEFVGLVFRKDGQLVLGTSKDAIMSIGKDQSVLITGDSMHQVGGKELVEIGNGEERTTIGNRDVTTTGDDQHIVSGKMDLQVAKALSIGAKGVAVTSSADDSHTVSGKMDLQVAGPLTVGAASISITTTGGGGGPCTMKCSNLDMQCSSFNIRKG